MNKISWATNMRMFAMLGIVFIHCSYYLEEIKAGEAIGFLNWAANVFFKPATILLFMISGYLFESKFDVYKSNSFRKFLVNKIKSLVLPYILIFVLFNLVFILFVQPNFGEHKYAVSYLKEIKSFFHTIFYSNYWFLPVLFLYLLVNYFIKKENTWYWLWASVFITVFYSLNIWFHFKGNAGHTTAIFGFMAFFLLGRLVSVGIFKKTTVSSVIVLAAFLCSLLESYLLKYDTNTIRLTNCLYSVLFFLRYKDFFGRINVPYFISRINYYFIYLIHPIVLSYIIDRFFVLNSMILFCVTIPRSWIYFTLLVVFSFGIEKVIFSFSNPISLMFSLHKMKRK
jgi:hypothetical protein